MICPPCAASADHEAAQHAQHPAAGLDTGHQPEVCRDHGLTPSGCGCQHRPVGTALEATG